MYRSSRLTLTSGDLISEELELDLILICWSTRAKEGGTQRENALPDGTIIQNQPRRPCNCHASIRSEIFSTCGSESAAFISKQDLALILRCICVSVS